MDTPSPAESAAKPAAENAAPPADAPAAEAAAYVDFETLKLLPGAPLQIQHLTLITQKYALKYMGSIKGKSIMISLPVIDGQVLRMLKGQDYVIRGFFGKKAYAFTSHVIQARTHPFPYAHFSYPSSVEAKAIRKSLRVEVNMPAVAKGATSTPLTITDISASGAMLLAPQTLGKVDETVNLQFSLDVRDLKAELTLSARIKNARYAKNAETLYIGVEFENISRENFLILNNFILSATAES